MYLQTLTTVAALAILTVGASVISEAREPVDTIQAADEPRGVLRQSDVNGRYFAHADGELVYLVGSHTWNNLVDMDETFPPRAFDFEAYLDFLSAHNHNFVRLWAWELPNPQSEIYERRSVAAPMAWARTGPGLDIMGLPRFDLTQLNPEYFHRLRTRVAEAHRRGFYVGVMLFEGWGVQFAPGHASHPFHRQNNINEVHYGDRPESIHTLTHSRITEIQRAYVRAVVDAVSDFDNVIYEIVNESGPESTEWQYDMIEFLREYQSSLGRQHPIGMSYQHPGGTNRTLMESSADWISPGSGAENYRSDPAPSPGEKVIISDTDHLGGSGFGNQQWVWKTFTRGLNPIFMDRYERPYSVSDDRYGPAREIRAAMGLTRLYATRLDLSALTPRPDLASGGFLLASDSEYLAYDPDGAGIPLDLRGRSGRFEVEWFDPTSGQTFPPVEISGGGVADLANPLDDEAVAYVYRAEEATDSTERALFESEARRIVNNSHAALVLAWHEKPQVRLALAAIGVLLLIGGAALAVRRYRTGQHHS